MKKFTSLFLIMFFGFLISLLSFSTFAKTVTYLYAAASTQNVVEAVLKSYNTKSEIRFLPVYGATSALARQILDGAPASLFLAANQAWMDQITENN
ncbi:MAG: substrate-binding domain-containing protein, partial [Pseudomonadota bacterium]|nr:substrate-binding domain-containing protein [Pseudomonadota bacterium]